MSDLTPSMRERRIKRIAQLESDINGFRVELGLPTIDYSAPPKHLADYYTDTRMSDQVTAEEFDVASEAAIEAIISAGFDSEDSDQLGTAMSDDVQTLLTLAFVRCPNLIEVFTHTLFDPSADLP